MSELAPVRKPQTRLDELRVAGICTYITRRLAACGMLGGRADWAEAKRFLASVPDDLYQMDPNLPPIRFANDHPDVLAAEASR